jgi:hypothetical protein
MCISLRAMDDSTIMSIAIGVGVSIGLVVASARQSKKNADLATRIEPLLREKGPLTLPALAEAMGMGGFMARGKVVLALNELQANGQVEVIPAPEGTPQLEKVNHILYRWRG